MFSNISNKRKLLLLGIGSGILLLIMYNMAIAKTLQKRAECNSLKDDIDNAQYTAGQLHALQSDLEQIQEVIHAGGDQGNNIRQTLLNEISNYCQRNGIVLTGIPEPVNDNRNGFIIQTNTICLKGPFKKLLGVVYMLEQENKVTRLISADFQMKRDPRSRTTNLHLDLFVQNIKPSQP